MVPTVLYDACVLYPAPLRDLLMQLALSRLFRARTALHDLLAAPAPHPPSSTLAQPEEQL